MVVQNQSQMGKGLENPTDPHHTPTFIQPSPQPQKTQKPRKPKRKDTQAPQPSDPTESVVDEVVHKELGDSLVRTSTNASSLETKQDSGGGPRCQETMGDTIAQTRFENVSKHSNDSLLARGNTLQSDEDRLKLDELMALSRVKSSDDEESLGEDASKQGRIDAIDADEEITLFSVHDEMEVDEEVVEVINIAKLIIDAAQVSVAGDKVIAASAATTVSAATTTTATTVNDITLAQALKEMKSTKPKTKGVVIQELDTTTKFSQLSLQQSQDKGKGIWIEAVKLMKKKDQIRAELVQESTKKQKVEDNKETAKIKNLMEIIPDEEEVAIDVIPLAVNHMLKSFDREDLETLYKLVKAKYESTRPMGDLDLLLWGDLKTMFESHIEDKVCRNQQDYKVLSWKLYDSYGVHSLRMKHVHIYMLVEKKYPLTPSTLSMMLEKKLMIDYESEMAYQLCKFIMKQLKK
ncbi:hypothetical protein Tco_1202961 [Tanacetum coccineum]